MLTERIESPTATLEAVRPPQLVSPGARAFTVVAFKEWKDLGRDSRFRILAGVTLLLMVTALIQGIVSVNRLHHDHEAAEAGDRVIWTAQGAKNPHSAAHFGQYAFKPVSPLAVADPGVDEFAGNAVYLEAHKQNEDRFRSARDGTLTARMGKLTLAFVLQSVVPLMAILLGFSAYAAERESGTLQQLLSLGVRPRDLLAGKALAYGGVILGMVATACCGLALGIAVFADDVPFSLADAPRVAGLALVYGLYLAGFLALSMSVSAWAGSSRAALVVLLGYWLANTFVMPRLASDYASKSTPLPTNVAFRADIAEARKAQFGHNDSHPAFVAFRDRVLREYGVSRVEDLPVSFRGLSLREDDESGYKVFDEHFGRIVAKIDRQDQIRSLAGFAFPLLALQPVSMAMAGTDNTHHADFVRAAESHRRLIQNAASQDLIDNARNGDESYKAGPELWSRIPPMEYQRPSAGVAWRNQAGNLAAVTIWFAVCSIAAAVAGTRPRLS
jgi:ABC-2 type transport system permease protein